MTTTPDSAAPGSDLPPPPSYDTITLLHNASGQFFTLPRMAPPKWFPALDADGYRAKLDELLPLLNDVLPSLLPVERVEPQARAASMDAIGKIIADPVLLWAACCWAVEHAARALPQLRDGYRWEFTGEDVPQTIRRLNSVDVSTILRIASRQLTAAARHQWPESLSDNGRTAQHVLCAALFNLVGLVHHGTGLSVEQVETDPEFEDELDKVAFMAALPVPPPRRKDVCAGCGVVAGGCGCETDEHGRYPCYFCGALPATCPPPPPRIGKIRLPRPQQECCLMCEIGNDADWPTGHTGEYRAELAERVAAAAESDGDRL